MWAACRPLGGRCVPVDPRYRRGLVVAGGPSPWGGGSLADAVSGCRTSPQARVDNSVEPPSGRRRTAPDVLQVFHDASLSWGHCLPSLYGLWVFLGSRRRGAPEPPPVGEGSGCPSPRPPVPAPGQCCNKRTGREEFLRPAVPLCCAPPPGPPALGPAGIPAPTGPVGSGPRGCQ